MRIEKYILCCIAGLLMLSAFLSCTKEPVAPQTEPEEEKYQGEMILFTSGTTDNVTKAAKTYYMPDGSRFVCRMYYKASMVSDNFDVTGGTDATTWLKVDGEMGNSLYWRNNYPTLDPANSSLFDSYNNDARATCLYWQNRKEHAFLAWTDLNKAATNVYSPIPYSGGLKFEPADEDYARTTGAKVDQWVETGLELYGDSNKNFTSWANLRNYLETGSNYVNNIKDRVPAGVNLDAFQGATYYYAYGLSCKYTEAVATDEIIDGTHKKVGWVQYQMFYDKVVYTGPKTGSEDPVIQVIQSANGVDAYLYDTEEDCYVAAIEVNFDESEPPVELSRTYYQTDVYGNVKYDENSPRYVFYFKHVMELRNVDEVVYHPANVFDLRSNGKSSISQQPDICQALTIQAPLGATQASNRVNLYFKHQFAQVQVNVKGSADESVQINASDIISVQLLGVTDKAYVFTELNEEGEVLPTAYEAVDVSKYTDVQLAENEYGTSFDMFDMGQANYALGYLKSFNAITYGQLQAIRIIWREQSGIEHKSTFVVSDASFKNLVSGTKYVWNIELRRGTLAVVQSEIVDWIVPQDGYEHNASGIIKD